MRITFIGGTAFIGHAAACDAIGRGHEVTCVHRGLHDNEVDGAASIIADRSDPEALAAAVRTSAPDVVVETLALTRLDAETSASALRDLNVPAVVLSSQDVYAQFGKLLGHLAPEPEDLVTEESPLTVPYPFRGKRAHSGGGDYDKKDVESVYRQAELPGTIVLRLPATYGPRDPQRRFARVLDTIDGGTTAFLHKGGGTWRWTHADVRDVGRAITLAAEAPAEGFWIYNVGEEEPPTMREWTDRIAQAVGVALSWAAAREEPPEPFGYLGTKRHDFVVSSERIRRELGYREVTRPAERLSGLVSWLRESRKADTGNARRS